MKFIYKFLANSHTERMKLIEAFGSLGYPCHVVIEKDSVHRETYYVHVYEKPEDRKEEKEFIAFNAAKDAMPVEDIKFVEVMTKNGNIIKDRAIKFYWGEGQGEEIVSYRIVDDK